MTLRQIIEIGVAYFSPKNLTSACVLEFFAASLWHAPWDRSWVFNGALREIVMNAQSTRQLFA